MHARQFEGKQYAGRAGAKDGARAPREGPLEIFVLPHTHDDVGWLQTVFGYYNSSVTHILTTVTETLSSNPSYRFIWSEIKCEIKKKVALLAPRLCFGEMPSTHATCRRV